jgi:hypothetical protein
MAYNEAMVARPSRGLGPASARSKRRPDPLRVALAALIAVALVALAWWWTHPPDPEAEVLGYHRPLVALERVPAPQLGRGFERWRMIAAGGDTVTGLWRAGASPQASNWAVVILGGIETDDRAALLVPDSLPIGVLAVSWPWNGPRSMSKLAFIASVPQLHTALLRTPGAIARGVEAVRRAGPGARVVLLGASLGVAPVVAALPLARPDALVLVDGAADLGRLLRSETARALDGGIAGATLAPPAAAFAARLLSSIEPARYGAAARGIPVLLVDAERDERYPLACVTRLHATFPHATNAMHPGGHLDPGNQRQVTEIVEAVWRWLGRVTAGPAVHEATPGPAPTSP